MWEHTPIISIYICTTGMKTYDYILSGNEDRVG